MVAEKPGSFEAAAILGLMRGNLQAKLRISLGHAENIHN
jgi:hypothetical protein